MVDSQKRIMGAFLVGALIVALAFVVSRESDANTAAGVITATSPRTHIETEDSNKDGVPDWQDALLKEDPIMLPTTSSSTYEEPTTVTGKFALRFFENFVRSKMFGAFGDTREELLETSTKDLSDQAVEELLSEKNITIFPMSDAQTLHEYGNQIASIILAQPNTGDSEAIILQDALRYEKPERLQELEPIALSYTTVVKQLLELPVPKTYVKEHLDLVNALNAVREDVRAMQKVEEDPLYTLVRLKRYEDDVLGMSNALTNIFNALYERDSVRYDQGEPVLELMTFPQ